MRSAYCADASQRRVNFSISNARQFAKHASCRVPSFVAIETLFDSHRLGDLEVGSHVREFTVDEKPKRLQRADNGIVEDHQFGDAERKRF